MPYLNASGSFEPGQKLVCLDPLGTHGKLICSGWYEVERIRYLNMLLPNTAVFSDYDFIDTKILNDDPFFAVEFKNVPGCLFHPSRFKQMETIASGEVRRAQ